MPNQRTKKALQELEETPTFRAVVSDLGFHPQETGGTRDHAAFMRAQKFPQWLTSMEKKYGPVRKHRS